MAAKLASLTAVKQFLEVREGDTAHDAKINRLIDIASRQIETYCNTLFDKVERTEVFNTYNNGLDRPGFLGSSFSGFTRIGSPRTFMLSAAPVDLDATFEVRYDVTRQFSDVTTLLTRGTDYIIDVAGGKAKVLALVGDCLASLQIKHNSGYPVTDGVAATPDDMSHACVVQVIFLWSKSLPDNVGQGTDNTGKQQSQYMRRDLFCDEAMGLVNGYRRIRVGQT